MRPPRPTQGVVRRAAFQERLTNHDIEIGVKVSATLQMWFEAIHEEVIRPLEARVAWLELPWWQRAWRRLKGERGPSSQSVVVAPGATGAGAAPEAATGGALDEESHQG